MSLSIDVRAFSMLSYQHMLHIDSILLHCCTNELIILSHGDIACSRVATQYCTSLSIYTCLYGVVPPFNILLICCSTLQCHDTELYI